MTAHTTAGTEFEDVAEFRSQLVAWLDENDLTPPADHSLDAHHVQHARVLGALYDAGWMRWGWPESAGGLGGPMILRAVVGEEIVGRGLDQPGPYSMLEVLTPTMIDYARPGLAAEMVPRLLSGRETWCQGFSEPGSGSDLASLTTRAEPRGDDWVINGQKVWTSFVQYATRCISSHPDRGRAHFKTSGHHRVLRRHGQPGRRRASTAHHAWRRRVLRGVLRRRRGGGRPHAREPRRRLATRDGPAAV